MTHEQLVEEMKDNIIGAIVKHSTGFDTIGNQRLWHLDIDTFQKELPTLITTTAQRVREETIEEVRKSFDEWFKNSTEDVEDWAERTLHTLNK